MSWFSKRVLPGGKKAALAVAGSIVGQVVVKLQTDPAHLLTPAFGLQVLGSTLAGAWALATRPVTMSHDDAVVAEAAIAANRGAATDGAKVQALATAPLTGNADVAPAVATLLAADASTRL